jgi:hypothetical protein
MPDDESSEILGSLPRTRPHRRSQKRGGRTEAPGTSKEEAPGTSKAEAPATSKAEARATSKAEAKPIRDTASSERGRPKAERPAPQRRAPRRRARPEPLRQPRQPSGTPPAPPSRRPIPGSGTELLSTVVQATAELAEIGLSVSARAVRNALGRLPRP